MRQLAYLYNQSNKAGNGYGYADLANWQSYLDRVSELGQTKAKLTAAETVTNEFVEAANMLDKAQVAADAEGYAVSDEWKSVELQGPIE
jgi:NitT/TauT family transport system substrate-binding protein